MKIESVLDLSNNSVITLIITDYHFIVENRIFIIYPIFPHSMIERESKHTFRIISKGICFYNFHFQHPESNKVIKALKIRINKMKLIKEKYLNTLIKGVECIFINKQTNHTLRCSFIIGKALTDVAAFSITNDLLWKTPINKINAINYYIFQEYHKMEINCGNETITFQTKNFENCKTIYLSVIWCCLNNKHFIASNMTPISLLYKRIIFNYLESISLKKQNKKIKSESYNDTLQIPFNSGTYINPSSLKKFNNISILRELNLNSNCKQQRFFEDFKGSNKLTVNSRNKNAPYKYTSNEIVENDLNMTYENGKKDFQADLLLSNNDFLKSNNYELSSRDQSKLMRTRKQCNNIMKNGKENIQRSFFNQSTSRCNFLENQTENTNKFEIRNDLKFVLLSNLEITNIGNFFNKS